MSGVASRDAVDAAKVFFNNDAERLQYINREMAIHDYESNMEGAREDGEKDMVVKMLKSGLLSMEQIAQISGFPLTEVKKLAAGQPA